MKKICKQLMYLCLLISIIFFLKHETTFAEEKAFNGYSVSQTIIKVQGKPGEVSQKMFRIKNESDHDTNVRIEVRDFELKDKKLLYKTDVPLAWSVAKWTSLQTKEFLLSANESKEIDLNISIPNDAEMGEHAALVAVQFVGNSTETSGAGNVKVATEILPVLYVTVTDQNGQVNLQKQWNLEGFTHSKNKDNTVLFQFHVSNTGNVHLESAGTISVRNRLSGSQFEVQIPQVNLLPNTDKVIVAEWKIPEGVGLYQIKGQITMDGEHYKVVNDTVYIIPWAYVGVCLITLFIIVIAIRIYINRLKRRMLQQAKEQLQAGEKKN